MKFSTRTEYGLRAILRVAHGGKKPYSLAKIASLEGLSLGYLEKLFAKLKKAGLVKSTKGTKGGYQLSRSPTEISLYEIIEVLEGSLAPYRCVDFRGLKMDCQRKCATQKVWQVLYKQIVKTLKNISLKQLMK